VASKEADRHVWENDEGELVVALDLPEAAAHPARAGEPAFDGRMAGIREYVVADVSTRTGRWVTRITESAQEARRRIDAGEDEKAVYEHIHLSDERESLLYERLLGSTYDDMENDEVPNQLSKFVGMIAYAWVVAGLEAARKCWDGGPDGGPKPANRQERRAMKKTPSTNRGSGSRSSTSGASATTTKRRTSTRGTKTPS
jgi:hypothetical protein